MHREVATQRSDSWAWEGKSSHSEATAELEKGGVFLPCPKWAERKGSFLRLKREEARKEPKKCPQYYGSNRRNVRMSRKKSKDCIAQGACDVIIIWFPHFLWLLCSRSFWQRFIELRLLYAQVHLKWLALMHKCNQRFFLLVCQFLFLLRRHWWIRF